MGGRNLRGSEIINCWLRIRLNWVSVASQIENNYRKYGYCLEDLEILYYYFQDLIFNYFPVFQIFIQNAL
jgi:hypothetical protein